jgi:Fe2+ or Zn2+ uptake regulation protein
MDLPDLEDKAAASSNYEIFSHRVYLYGLCPDCATKRIN